MDDYTLRSKTSIVFNLLFSISVLQGRVINGLKSSVQDELEESGVLDLRKETLLNSCVSFEICRNDVSETKITLQQH